jgi:rhomboid family protein
VDRFDLFILSVAGAAWLIAVGAAHHWPGASVLHRIWDRVEPYLGAYVRSSPATFVYAGIIFVTTWVAAGLSRAQRDALLRTQSTNLHNLRTHPVDVLFRSAFWSGSTAFLPFLLLLAIFLAPAEVWLGTFRLILIFALGHVGATLLTAVAISHGVFTSSGEEGLARTIDVGVSYGTFCVAAVLTYRLPKRWRLPYAAALLFTFSMLAFVLDKTFTDFGHFLSVLIGFAAYPFVSAHGVTARARRPLYRPWLPAAPPPAPTEGDALRPARRRTARTGA